MSSPLTRVSRLGQSVWIDWLSCDLLSSGGLQRLIAEHAVTGVTTNPTILERAIASGHSYVSWEVDPALAWNTPATLAAVRELRQLVQLPNLLIKVPATEPGLRALDDATAAGYSINVTLIFSLERYAAVVEAYLRGLRRAADLVDEQAIRGALERLQTSRRFQDRHADAAA